MKVAIYCRLSDEDKDKQNETDDSRSIQNQKSMLIQYAVNNNWEIYNIYSDDDYRGADRSRPEWNKLLKDAEEQKFQIILCKSQARFTREMELVEKYLHYLFPLWNIRFVSLVDNADTHNKGNKKSRQINGLVNEWYLEDLSSNIKGAFRTMQEKGHYIGGFYPYGYLKDPNQKGHLIIDTKAAPIIKEIFDLYLEGHGKNAIAKILNSKGIPNPTEYKRRQGVKYRPARSQNSTLWSSFAIADILVNEMYIGNMVQRKSENLSYKSNKKIYYKKKDWIIVKDTHDPIIKMEIWDRVQEQVKLKYKSFGNGKVGLFAKKVRCLTCGYTLRSSKSHDRYYLKCTTKYKHEAACIGAFIPVKKLEKIVLTELKKLNELYFNNEMIEEGINVSANLVDKKNNLKQQIKQFENSFLEYSKAIKDLYLDKTKGIISDSEFIELKTNFNCDKEKQEENIDLLNKEIAEIDIKLKSEGSKQDIVKKYSNISKLTRPIVVELIDYILVGKKDPVTKEIPIEIHWDF